MSLSGYDRTGAAGLLRPRYARAPCKHAGFVYPCAMLTPRSIAVATLACFALIAAPASAATRNCNVQNDAGTYGVTYVTSLKVTNVTCARGKRVVRAFHRCRKANGGIKGRCATRVLGFRCTEDRSAIATQFSSRVVCRDGTRRVVHTYTQNT